MREHVVGNHHTFADYLGSMTKPVRLGLACISTYDIDAAVGELERCKNQGAFSRRYNFRASPSEAASVAVTLGEKAPGFSILAML